MVWLLEHCWTAGGAEVVMRIDARWVALALMFTAPVVGSAGEKQPAAGESPEAFFGRKVRPVLAASWVKCHGPVKASGGLRLDSREAILKGGETGPAVVPGDPGSSLLVRAIG